MNSAIVLFNLFKFSEAVTGLIWDKSRKDFISLFHIPSFLMAKNKYTKKLRNIEFHNFHRAVLKLAYFEEGNLFSYVDNDTRVSGVCGEIWNNLADFLNFTLVPIKLGNRSFGNKLDNGSYDGILGLIQQNKSQIIPRTGFFSSRLPLLDFTLPLWKVRYHLYSKPEWKHDEEWIFHLFSPQVWYTFFLTLLVLGTAGFLCGKYSRNDPKKNITIKYKDHIFYTLAIASSRGGFPPEFLNNSRLIYICTSLFSWVLLIAFSSHAIFLLMNKKFILPFTDLESLIQSSKYNVIGFSGSMVQQEFENTVQRYFRYTRDSSRVSYSSSAYTMFHKVCFSKKQYAAFEAADRYKAIGKDLCRLVSTDAYYFETWVAAAIKRGFLYKRSFDIGIMKMFESGLVDGLKARWLEWKFEEDQEVPFQSIDVVQVYLMFAILCIGLTISIFILLLECMTDLRKDKLFRKIAKRKVTSKNASRVI